MKKKNLIILVIGGIILLTVIGFIFIKMQQQIIFEEKENNLDGLTKYAEDYVEVLIKTSDNIPSKLDTQLWDVKTTEEFERASFRQGYIVDVRQEDWNWGTLERDGKRFVIVKIPKRLWNESWIEQDIDVKGNEIRIRKYMVDLESILSTEELTSLKELSYNSKEVPSIEIKIIEDFDKLVKPIDLESMPDLWVSHGSSGDFTMCQAGAPTCDYSTLTGFESGEQADLTGSGNATLTITGSWTVNDTTTVVVDGWTCDVDDHIILQTTGLSRHKGIWNESAYRLVSSATRGIAIKESYTEIYGLQIWAPAEDGIWFLEGSNWTAGYNLLVNRGFDLTLATTGYVKIFNNIIYGAGATRGILINDADIFAYVYSNTIYHTANVGIYAQAGNVLAKNNVVQGTAVYDYYGTFNSSSSNNLAEDTTAGGQGVGSQGTCTYVDATNKNYHLNDSDTTCKDNGNSLSSDSYLAFSTDIDGETRTGNWDIGADEIVSGEPPSDCWSNLGFGLTYVPNGCLYYINVEEYFK